jgi:rhamnogalacturonyl hydrolase YesR
MMKSRKNLFFARGFLIGVGCLAILSGAQSAHGEWDDMSDPLKVAMAAADRELFGRVIQDDAERPEVRVHHDLIWEDATLLAGVYALYDRMEELGRPVPRYLDYIEAWSDRRAGIPGVPIVHGDLVTSGMTYIWMYDKSGKTSEHLERTDRMISFIFLYRKPTQWMEGYGKYWMRFWQDDVHMVAPFLAMRGRSVGNKGIPNFKDAREIAVEYCRAYDDVLRDPATGLFWHNPRARGDYHWGRGNGWVAAGYYKVMKVLEEDPAYADDAAWLKQRLIAMAKTLKDNRNPVGTWTGSITDIENYPAPETSGSGFFTYMITGMINSGYLGDEYVPVVQKAWNFLRLSVTDKGDVMRVQPVGRGPIEADFERNSDTYGIGALILAAIEMSKMSPGVLAGADDVECMKLDSIDIHAGLDTGSVRIDELRARRPDFPADPSGGVQAVFPGRRLPPTFTASNRVEIRDLPDDFSGELFLFYAP